MQWNKIPGPFEIRITAVKDQARAGIISKQYLSEAAAPKSGGTGTFQASHHLRDKLLIAGGVAAGACAQSGLEPPQLGFIAASNHSLRPVVGFPGNLFLGEPAGDDVVSLAWSGTYGFAKTDSSLMVLNEKGQMLAGIETDPDQLYLSSTPTARPRGPCSPTLTSCTPGVPKGSSEWRSTVVCWRVSLSHSRRRPDRNTSS